MVDAASFHPEAERELEEAAEWYDRQRDGLGGEFVAAVKAKILRALEAPERYPVVHGARRALIERFPYAIVYRARDSSILVIAIAHLKRRSKYWIGR